MDTVIVEFKISSRNPSVGELRVLVGEKVVDKEEVLVGPRLDHLLIKTLDKLLQKNRIKKLRVKSFKIRGKLSEKSLSGSILKSIQVALDY